MARDDFKAANIIKQGLPPIADKNARILILGTLPGDQSLMRQQYYGNPRNHFWPIVASVFDEKLPSLYDERIAMLAQYGVAVWDVLMSAERSGSLDSAIKNATPNDFAEFFDRHPKLRTIAFNGQKAHALYRAHIIRDPSIPHVRFRMQILPSSSPTYVRAIGDKIEAWRAFLRS